MNSAEAIKRLEILRTTEAISNDDARAIRIAIEALNGNPCAVCAYQPPIAGYGKPCLGCPAVGMAIKEGEE